MWWVVEASSKAGPPSSLGMDPHRLVDDFVAELNREEQPVREQPIVDIATSPSSALCRTALLLLEDLSIPYRELVIGRDITEAELVRRKGGPFVLLPLVFVAERFVGGYAELKALAAAGADAVLSAGKPVNATVRSNNAVLRAASPQIFERLHNEAEINYARRAALQRHGSEYGLHSTMSRTREVLSPRPHSPLRPAMWPSFNSPGRELVSQTRAGAGIRAMIRTDRAGMRYDSVHSAVRCGGGWEPVETRENISHRSRSPVYTHRQRKRRTPPRTPGPVNRVQPEPEPEPEQPPTQLNVDPDDSILAAQQALEAERRSTDTLLLAIAELDDDQSDDYSDIQSLETCRLETSSPLHGELEKIRARVHAARAKEPLSPVVPQQHDEEETEQSRIHKQRVQVVGNKLAELGCGVRLGNNLTDTGEVPLLGLDGGIITTVPPLQAGGGEKLQLLVQLLEGACDRID